MVGPYRLFLTSTAYEDRATKQSINFFPLIIIIVVIVALQFINRTMFRSMAIPLIILEYGLHEIRDGNLDFHIQYGGKDVFALICNDFNEMVRQIQKLMEARQKEYLQTIVEQADDLNHIVDQLFQFSTLDMEDFPLSL